MVLRYKRNNALLRYRPTDVGKAYTVFKKNQRVVSISQKTRCWKKHLEIQRDSLETFLYETNRK